MPPLRPILAAAVALLAALVWAGSAAAAAPEPWKAAADVRSGLRDAGVELLTGDEAVAAAEVGKATAAYETGLEEPIDRADGAAGRDARSALRDAADAARRGNVPALAAARGALAAALMRGSAATSGTPIIVPMEKPK